MNCQRGPLASFKFSPNAYLRSCAGYCRFRIRKRVIPVTKRDTFRPSDVTFLNDVDIVEIVADTFPGRRLSPTKLRLLKELINAALFAFYAPVDSSDLDLRPAFDDVQTLLIDLNRKLALSKTRWLLAKAGRSYASAIKANDNREFDKLMLAVGYSDFSDFVEFTIMQLRQSLKEISKWVDQKKSAERVLQGLSPRLRTRTPLIRDWLPAIFEKIFEQRCRLSHNGPGSRFIATVLRRSRLHKGNRKRIIATVVRSQSRGKAASRLRQTT
jgi:hypothetical protein